MRDWRSVKHIYGRRWERRDPLDIPETGLSTQLLIVQRETLSVDLLHTVMLALHC